MPLPRIKTLLLMLSVFTALLLTCYLSFTTFAPASSSSRTGQATSSFLFPASAVISLTDDNSTFFISRPAAFGPPLPKDGMDGELFVLEEGQLACDDTPGWDPSAAVDLDKPLLPQELEDDGTDDSLNPSVSSAVLKSNVHADIESLQQSAEIGGKIVLVSRGGCGFLEKVLWTQRRGGKALIVGDYKRSGLGGGGGGLVTMFAKGDTSNVTIQSVFTSHTTATLLTTLLPKPAIPSVTSPSIAQYLDPHRTAPVHPRKKSDKDRSGLWITLTPTTMTSSPFFDTLLVLVVSPLVTLSVVYTLLLIRSRIRRRRWRAPKSVVERLPVRTYQSLDSAPPTPQNLTFPPRSSSLPTGSSSLEPVSIIPSSPLAPPPRRETASAPLTNVDRFERRGWSGSTECVVCLEEYVDGVSRVMKLPCGHEFHADCITPWLTTRRRTCPICKGDVVRGCKAATSGNAETAGDGADETTPLVLGVDIEQDDGTMDGREEGGWPRPDLEHGGSSSDWRG
ncbi:hypothetical protein EDC01DRAFT_621912 [Geopyxis carbonaria]|nr:hypothetical protein EDC01DRAFT_621912 [Geopyxis carbonaria]